MKYVLLIYDDPQALAGMDDAARGEMYEEYGKYYTGLEERGIIRGGQQLAPPTSATMVTIESGATLTTDGPYAETKEQLGGFFLIECDTLDEAVEAAAQIPSAKHGGKIEVRPILEM